MTTNMNIRPTTECVRDSSESLKQLADSILESSKMLYSDIDGVGRFLFNSPADPNKKELPPEPMCLADSLKHALEVLASCKIACTYIQERLG